MTISWWLDHGGSISSVFKQDAVNMFYDSDRPAGAADDNGDSQGAETSHNPAEEGEPSHETHQISEGDGSQEYASVNRKQADHTAQASSSKTSEPSLLSSRVRLITWNIDGLDEKCIGQRTRAVCEILKRYAPDIIFLQEVIPETCK
ncbi:tyrosyl-DNA phosphodiesterase 2-like, partial [Acanthaster planci]|uniref:Tyrosyl-DNA phosphodiesterase 2-like n=1 Tax=Acanthaster planci TaxID=133434 RepID=A0A8B7Y6R3_ACAPL